jgi:MFS transporter, YNFM family, putative membrane transport protein
MKPDSQLLTQVLVFSLVAAAFTTVYITQAVLPVIENEFGIDPRTASLSVSMVIFGVALSNLPFGMIADRYPKKPTMLIGRTVITATSPVCAETHNIAIFIAAWFIQGRLRAAEMKVSEGNRFSKTRRKKR